ncbi:unnamed protein product [Caenorhabditis auriculariae]|uniref:Uncharacterized protein n=1 Tax=Caenorhabditis auriculariae TaxID=2777116 RepID=A0A8S1H082_9PELO|nr:unnamed protein product [Caenorhabditis auriculariae]
MITLTENQKRYLLWAVRRNLPSWDGRVYGMSEFIWWKEIAKICNEKFRESYQIEEYTVAWRAACPNYEEYLRTSTREPPPSFLNYTTPPRMSASDIDPNNNTQYYNPNRR